MKSYSGAKSLPFTSEHAAWCDTISDAYCDDESSEYTSLHWTDLSTTKAIQLWKMMPAGFGAFFNVCSGQQLIVIVAPKCANEDKNTNFLAQSCYLHKFNRLDPGFYSENHIKAIQLEAGNHL